jgi:hypothetical protein
MTGRAKQAEYMSAPDQSVNSLHQNPCIPGTSLHVPAISSSGSAEIRAQVTPAFRSPSRYVSIWSVRLR